VVGWREEAVSFARARGYHLIVNSEQRPFYYSFGLQDVKSKWYEGIFDLGLRSLLPIPFDVERVALEDGVLKVVTRGNTKVLINFKSLHLFDLDNCGHMGAEQIVEDYSVHDIFDVIAGSQVGREIVLTLKDTFVKTVKFVPSNRIDRNTSGDFKDIITTSVIGADDINSFDCSETVVRILLERKNNFHFKIVDEMDKRLVLHE
jgi:hypothetical protein